MADIGEQVFIYFSYAALTLFIVASLWATFRLFRPICWSVTDAVDFDQETDLVEHTLYDTSIGIDDVPDKDTLDDDAELPTYKDKLRVTHFGTEF